MTKSRGTTVQPVSSKGGSKPRLNIGKIGIVTRDYRFEFSNGYRDFSHAFPQLIKMLDAEECDTVLFSLFSFISRKGYDCLNILKGLKNIKAVLLEEFQDGKNREAGRYVVYHRTPSGVEEYEFCQVFGKITGMPQQKIQDFVQNEIPRRTLGNCCVLLCGETNGVKYSKVDKRIYDTFGLRKAIPHDAKIILNPIHDRMTRFEMKLKRQFLSKKNRWVISVWNKGKQDINGKIKDGNGAAWTVFHNGYELDIPRIQNDLGVEIGVLNVKRA